MRAAFPNVNVENPTLGGLLNQCVANVWAESGGHYIGNDHGYRAKEFGLISHELSSQQWI